MATRSISISLDAELIKALERELESPLSTDRNRSAAMAEALELWLKQRQFAALQRAYAQLACLEAGDLEAASTAAAAMGQQSLESAHG